MSQLNGSRYVLCLNGGRVVNRRMAIYIEGVRAGGIAVRVWAVPRGRWVLDKSEQVTTPDRIGSMSVDLGPIAGATLTSILCFHWSVLPIAVLLGLIRRVPVLYDEYDHFELNALEGERSQLKNMLFNFVVRWIHRMCLPWVSVVTCIHMHHSALKTHLQHWQPNVLEIHNYPAAVWRQSARPGLSSGRLCFVYIGGVYVEKGCGAAAEAFQMLPEAVRSQCELHIFGEGDARLIDSLRTIPGVTVYNGVTPARFRGFAATHRCCGLALLAGTTRYNMVGTNCTKLYEYLALGMPVIGTRVGEFPDWIEGRHVGLLIDADLNTAQLSEQMQRLAADAALFAQLSANASELMASDEMTWEHQWKRIKQTGIVDRLVKVA
ncbi:MAG: glycosyltransferase family 4 protein [Planctomycetota bacterium]